MGGFKIENVSQNLFRKLTKFVTEKVGASKLHPETNLYLGLITYLTLIFRVICSMADITAAAKKGRTGQTSFEQLESILNWILKDGH